MLIPKSVTFPLNQLRLHLFFVFIDINIDIFEIYYRILKKTRNINMKY